ncbi:helix-turn-helix transcriptional regulator [Arthrobacter sp. SDTb3-6]|uniref:ArsR/SmtB family transcription factor n=1 Tax=Arthrobacter sp. SDTb3-6 TaxID=2713571 RepID=UPI00159E6751|nr:metalloregulator ArsR/SmtB family transcription factor [Arthrobacter sp. SDTb3-6]NVN00115.1 winged helix-turn-helix transcriptional regulator [Arthrobacter sp. SDTb3-6]
MQGTGSDDERLDKAFLALADPVRRSLVARLSRSSATVNELAAPFQVSKQAISKHIQVLEKAGLITRSRDGQRRPCHLAPAALEELTSWIDGYRLAAEARFRALDRVLAATKSADHPEHE